MTGELLACSLTDISEQSTYSVALGTYQPTISPLSAEKTAVSLRDA